MMQNDQRTAEELLDCKFNYYIAFGIDPAENDKTKIENKIRTVFASTMSGSMIFRRLIELRADILEVMVNDAVFDGSKYVPNSGGRQKELAAAKKIKLKDAVGVVEMLCRSRNMLLKSELDDIYQNAAKPVAFFTDKEFYAAIDPLLKTGVKVIDNVDSRIPFRDYEQAEQHLEPLKKADLYDFLGLPHTASADEIESAKEKVYQQSTKINDLKKKQSYSALCRYVQEILLTDAKGREAYDRYLLLKDKVWSEFKSRKDFAIKELSLDEYEKYVQTTMDLAKVSREQAEQIIEIGCKWFNLSVKEKSAGNNLEGNGKVIGFYGSSHVLTLSGNQNEAIDVKEIKLRRAVGIVEMLCKSRRLLLKSELEDIYRNAAKPVAFFTDKEFYAAIDYLLKTGVKVIDNVDSRIPFRDYEQAEQHLEPLKKADLYDFLGLPHTASADEIKSAKDKVYQQSCRIFDLKKKQSISASCGDVQKILLADAKGRAAYDLYLLLKDKVWSEFKSRKDYSIKDLSLDEYEKYVQKTMELAKVSREQAEQIIGIGCRCFRLSLR